MLKNVISFSVFAVIACFGTLHAEEVYYQTGDIAYAFELDSIVFKSADKTKFDITAKRQLVGVEIKQEYTGNFDEDNITQYHINFDCKNKTMQILDMMISDKNNGALKYKTNKKGEVIKAQSENLNMLNLVCGNVETH